jgi:hypothetical protein
MGYRIASPAELATTPINRYKPSAKQSRMPQFPSLFPASWFSGRFNLALSGFFLFFYAGLLSFVLVLGLVLPVFVLDYAMVILHRKTTPTPAGRSGGTPDAAKCGGKSRSKC